MNQESAPVTEQDAESTKIEDENKKSWYDIVRKHRAEVVIAVSSVMIVAELPFKKFLVQLVGTSLKGQAASKVITKLSLIAYAPVAQLLLWVVVPVASLWLLREPLKKYGVRLGDWKRGLLYATGCVLLLAPLLYWASTMPDFVRYYKRRLNWGLLFLIVRYGLYMMAWEFLLRGYLYFSLEERVGAVLAIFIQSAPFTIAHLGKPAPEALTCYFGGLILGYISMKTRSFVYAWLIHWGIYATLLAFVFLRYAEKSNLPFLWK